MTQAATGTARVFHAIMQTPDVVVLDLGLSDIDGMEVIRRKRESSQVPQVACLRYEGTRGDFRPRSATRARPENSLWRWLV